MKLFFMFFLFNLLVSFPLISTFANAQVRSNDLSQYSDWRICNEKKMLNQEWIEEAKRRGLNCGVTSSINLKSKYSDWRVCDEVKMGNISWYEEARRRSLNCAVTSSIKLKSQEIKEKLEREKKIRAKEEEARKKKIADEKARKIAEKKRK